MLSTKGCDRSSDGGAMGIDQNSDGAVIVLEGHRRLGSTLEDKRGFVLWSVYFMGVVMMMPWNMLINVNYFWDYKVSRYVCQCPLGTDTDSIEQKASPMYQLKILEYVFLSMAPT